MQKGGQDLSQGMDDAMCHVLCTGAELEDREKLGAGIDSEPEPEDLLGAAQPGAEFVQLQMQEVQVAEAVLVQGVRMITRTGQKGW
jgi:hypothetical protein